MSEWEEPDDISPEDSSGPDEYGAYPDQEWICVAGDGEEGGRSIRGPWEEVGCENCGEDGTCSNPVTKEDVEEEPNGGGRLPGGRSSVPYPRPKSFEPLSRDARESGGHDRRSERAHRVTSDPTVGQGGIEEDVAARSTFFREPRGPDPVCELLDSYEEHFDQQVRHAGDLDLFADESGGGAVDSGFLGESPPGSDQGHAGVQGDGLPGDLLGLDQVEAGILGFEAAGVDPFGGNVLGEELLQSDVLDTYERWFDDQAERSEREGGC